MPGNIDTSQSMDQWMSPMTPYVNSLQSSNDRLASYIESKKVLECENARLQALLKSSIETNDREAVMKKKLYADDLAEKDKCLNEVALEKAKLEIDYRKAVVDNDNLRVQLNQLQNQLEETQVNLKNEIIARIDLDNSTKTVQESLMFELELNAQLNMTRREVDTSEMNSHLGDQCNFQLQESLQELREHCGNEIRANRNEMQSMLESKLKSERNSLYRENKSLNSALDSAFARIGELDEANARLSAQIRNLEQALEGERTRSVESAIELKILGREMDSQLKKYQDLLDTKLALSLEVTTYQQLLCNGEQDSSITPPAKRHRKEFESIPRSILDPMVTSTSAGNVEIVQIDSVFVKLRNVRGNEAVLMDGWQLIRRAGGNTTVHKFDRSIQVAIGGDLVVWSADSGAAVLPGNIIDEKMWIVGDEITFTLVNGKGIEEAKHIEKKRSPGNIPIHEPNEKVGHKCWIM